MKKVITSILLLQIFIFSFSQQDKTNYDESRVPAYTLPDPLVFNDGSTVSSGEGWEKRRNEIYRTFENEVYGMPSAVERKTYFFPAVS